MKSFTSSTLSIVGQSIAPSSKNPVNDSRFGRTLPNLVLAAKIVNDAAQVKENDTHTSSSGELSLNRILRGEYLY